MRARTTKPIVANADEVRSIYRYVRAVQTENRVTAAMLLIVIVAVAVTGLALRRADLAEMRMRIYEEQSK